MEDVHKTYAPTNTLKNIFFILLLDDIEVTFRLAPIPITNHTIDELSPDMSQSITLTLRARKYWSKLTLHWNLHLTLLSFFSKSLSKVNLRLLLFWKGALEEENWLTNNNISNSLLCCMDSYWTVQLLMEVPSVPLILSSNFIACPCFIETSCSCILLDGLFKITDMNKQKMIRIFLIIGLTWQIKFYSKIQIQTAFLLHFNINFISISIL